MRRRLVRRLRRDSAVLVVIALEVWLIFHFTGDADRGVTDLAAAAVVAPMVVGALYYGARARRLARREPPSRAEPYLLAAGQAVCAVLLALSAAETVQRWGRLDPVGQVVAALVLAWALLGYLGLFHRRFTRTPSGGLRLVRSPMHRALRSRWRIL